MMWREMVEFEYIRSCDLLDGRCGAVESVRETGFLMLAFLRFFILYSFRRVRSQYMPNGIRKMEYCWIMK